MSIAAARRPDGRAPTQLRPVKIVHDYLKFAEGSVLIRVGDTRVLCAVTIEDRVPGWLRGKGTGWVTAEYSMLPRAGTECIVKSGTDSALSVPPWQAPVSS